MWKRFPYHGFLLLAAVLFAASWALHWWEERRYEPERVAVFLEHKIAQMDATIGKVLHSVKIETHINESPEPVERMGIFHYRDGRLVAWNTDKYTVGIGEVQTDRYTLLDKGFVHLLAIAKRPDHLPENEWFIFTIPLIEHYPITNQYLANGIIDLKEATESFALSTTPEEGSLAVKIPNGAPLYMSFDPDEGVAVPPHNLTWVLCMLAGLVMLSWSFTISSFVGRRYSKEKGFFLLVILLALPLLFIYKWGFPVDMGTLPLFGPELFASNKMAPSLGHLVVVVVLFTTLIAYLITQRVFAKTKVSDSRLERALWGIYISALGAVCYGLLQFVIFTLVFDSGVSLQITRFSSLNIYSFICLLIIAVLYASGLSLISHTNFFIHRLRLPAGGKLLMRIVTALAIFYYFSSFYNFSHMAAVWATRDYYWITTLWFLAYIYLVDGLHVSKTEIKLFGKKIIFWAVFVGLSVTGLVFFFNNLKERNLRENFAERLTDSRDEGYEWDFVQIAQRIEQDTTLALLLDRGDESTHAKAEQYLRENFFANTQNLYTYHFFIEHKTHNPITNPEDSAAARVILKELLEGQPTASPHLFYSSHQSNRANYVAAISTRLSNNKATGRILICSHAKEPGAGNLYLEVLTPSQNELNNLLPYYSYAIYNKGVQTYHNDGYTFPREVPQQLPPTAKKYWKEYYNYSELWLRPEENTVIAVVAADNKVWTFITLFSYFFCSLMVAGLVLQMTHSVLNYAIMRRHSKTAFLIPFTGQINFALLGVVILVVVIIGIATRYFIRERHDESIRNRYYSTKGILERKLQSALKETPASTINAQALVSTLSADYNVNVDLYNHTGKLIASSHPEIEFMQLRSTYMDYDAYYAIANGKANTVFENKTLGNLRYLTMYSAIKDDDGQTLAYINMPYYRYQKEIRAQLDSIVLAMVNIYTILFLLVSFAAVYFTKGISRTLNFIIEKFETISLQHNVLKEWTRHDEIGRLMRAYNKMAVKLQENATLMKTSERESAWREMAQQVAHEIKNPLTPIKLNIQYLNKLMDESPELAQQRGPQMLSNILLQIDHLTRIASEFSDFAKLPQVHPERLHLQKLLAPTIALYRDDGSVHILFDAPEEPLYVMADAGHITRAITNLLQNAVQAMPDKYKGHVHVRVKKENNTAIIAVQDNGVGIDEAAQEKIFQPHFTTKSSGTGLGLAMTKKIIEESNGTIAFESQPKKGTTFTIELPLLP